MRYKNVCCAPPPPYQPAPTAMPKFMHFRTVKNEQRERGRASTFSASGEIII